MESRKKRVRTGKKSQKRKKIVKKSYLIYVFSEHRDDDDAVS